MLAFLLAQAMTGALPPPGEAEFNARIRESVNAAESQQGPLDGGWTLLVGGQPRYVLQIVDPANGGRLQAAWRAWGEGPATPMGPVSEVVATGQSLMLTLKRPGASAVTTIQLHKGRGRPWSGEIVDGGAPASAVLRRN